uniref:Sushi domain-containing protein n=1 Tax=Cyprinus carpio TaxID=7962 RepID=A0A8C2E0K8_CYPCA
TITPHVLGGDLHHKDRTKSPVSQMENGISSCHLFLITVMTVSGKCGPPPDVNDADTKEMTKNEYNTRERVEYSCFNKYTLDQRPPLSKYLTCEQGEWRGNIKCLSKYEHSSP